MRKGKQRGSKRPPARTEPKPRVRPERFLIVFTLCVLISFGLLAAPFLRPAVDLFSQTLVKGAAFLITTVGGAASIQGTTLRAQDGGFAVNMKDGCNGVNVMLLLWSAVFAFPATWKWKLNGLVLGSIAIQGLNLVRFVSLFYLGQYNMRWFELAHSYLWESLIILDAMVVFWVWVTVAVSPARVPHAAA